MAVEVAVAYEQRVPHSVFLAWGKDDRDKAIWHHLRERDRCPSCGTRTAEWDETRGGDRDAYAAVLKVCRGCQVKDVQQRSIKGTATEKIGGLSVTLERPQPAQVAP